MQAPISACEAGVCDAHSTHQCRRSADANACSSPDAELPAACPDAASPNRTHAIATPERACSGVPPNTCDVTPEWACLLYTSPSPRD
eukprot:12949227-Alexandrium_andersonii.AAC.1